MERDELEQWLCGPDVPPLPPCVVATALGLPAELLVDTTLLRTISSVRSLGLTLAVLLDTFADDADVERWLDDPREALDGASPCEAILTGHAAEVEALAIETWNESSSVAEVA
jgi:hypothetical protein